MVQPHQVEKDHGDGSRTEMEDQKTEDKWETKDQRADTQTTFWPQDIASLRVSERRKWRLRRMLRRQEGEDFGEGTSKDKSRRQRKQQNRGEWKRRMASTFASQLDLTRAQKERVTHLVRDILDINSFGYFSTEEVILAVINVVAREDGRWIEEERLFHDLMYDVGLYKDEPESPDMNGLKTLRRMVRERIGSL